MHHPARRIARSADQAIGHDGGGREDAESAWRPSPAPGARFRRGGRRSSSSWTGNCCARTARLRSDAFSTAGGSPGNRSSCTCGRGLEVVHERDRPRNHPRRDGVDSGGTSVPGSRRGSRTPTAASAASGATSTAAITRRGTTTEALRGSHPWTRLIDDDATWWLYGGMSAAIVTFIATPGAGRLPDRSCTVARSIPDGRRLCLLAARCVVPGRSGPRDLRILGIGSEELEKRWREWVAGDSSTACDCRTGARGRRNPCYPCAPPCRSGAAFTAIPARPGPRPCGSARRACPGS